MGTIIRDEKPGDEPKIHKLLVSAFPTEQEALLVDRLRKNDRLQISLVAELDGEIAGQIAFSPVRIEHAECVIGAGLAPLAVQADWQRRGIGAQLVRAGLSACETAGTGFIVVLGEPDFYRRFGFQKASLRGITNAYGVDEPFMVLELRPGFIGPGLARYAPEFAGLAP